jgi:O-antigen/teichoic acid export membrane protein
LTDPPGGAGAEARRASMLVAASPFLNATIGFLSTGILAQILSFESFGLYLNWVYAAAVVSMVCCLGLSTANAYTAAKTPERIPEIRGYSLAVALAAGSLGAVALHLYTSHAALAVPSWAAASLPLSVPFAVALYACNAVNLGNGENVRYVLYTGLPVWLQFCALAAVWAFPSHQALALPVALASYAAGFAVALAALLTSAPAVARPAAGMVRRTMHFAAPLWVHSIFVVLFQRIDVLLLSHMLSPTDVGRFALGSKLADVLSYAPHGLGLAMFASFVQSGTDRSFRRLGASIRLYFVFGGAGALAVWMGCAWVLPLVVPKVESTLPLLPLLLAAAVLLGPLYLLSTFCQARGDSRPVLGITAGSLLIKLAFLLPLVAAGGLRAAPPAVLTGAFFALLLALGITARAARRSAVQLLLPQRSDWGRVKELVPPIRRILRHDWSCL